MREIGEQWVEELDGKMHMYKAVEGESCKGCTFGMMHKGSGLNDIHVCDREDDCPLEYSNTVVHDLGPVNNIGLPLCPFCKGCPELESEENWEGKDIWFVECDECGARTSEYLEDAEAIDAWNRRA